jgi:hypothetical protein
MTPHEVTLDELREASSELWRCYKMTEEFHTPVILAVEAANEDV